MKPEEYLTKKQVANNLKISEGRLKSILSFMNFSKYIKFNKQELIPKSTVHEIHSNITIYDNKVKTDQKNRMMEMRAKNPKVIAAELKKRAKEASDISVKIEDKKNNNEGSLVADISSIESKLEIIKNVVTIIEENVTEILNHLTNNSNKKVDNGITIHQRD